LPWLLPRLSRRTGRALAIVPAASTAATVVVSMARFRILPGSFYLAPTGTTVTLFPRATRTTDHWAAERRFGLQQPGGHHGSRKDPSASPSTCCIHPLIAGLVGTLLR
jgi:hypothetical protein